MRVFLILVIVVILGGMGYAYYKVCKKRAEDITRIITG